MYVPRRQNFFVDKSPVIQTYWSKTDWLLWKLIMKTKRIIFSNVYPIMPHNVILEAFKQMGIHLSSS